MDIFLKPHRSDHWVIKKWFFLAGLVGQGDSGERRSAFRPLLIKWGLRWEQCLIYLYILSHRKKYLTVFKFNHWLLTCSHTVMLYVARFLTKANFCCCGVQLQNQSFEQTGLMHGNENDFKPTTWRGKNMGVSLATCITN